MWRAALARRLRLLHGREPSVGEVDAAMARLEGGASPALATGLAYFGDALLACPPGVLTPRADSETLLAAAWGRGTAGARAADLGCGSGALLVAFLLGAPEASGVGLDASPEAVAVSRDNARRNGVADRAAFQLRDWNDAAPEQFDLVLWNPPYVESHLVRHLPDPPAALDGGPDGLAEYARAPWHFCRPGGLLIAEVGFGQAERAQQLMCQGGAGFLLETVADLGGVTRALVLQKS